MPPARPSAYLLDLDGTLYANGAAIPGAPELLQRLRASGTPFRLVTNTTSRSRADLVTRLRGFGFEVEPADLFTAPMAGADLAARMGYRTAVPFLPAAALPDLVGLDLAGGTSGRALPDGWRADAVIVGDLGAAWRYEVLQEAFEHLLSCAALIALSRDRYWLRDERLALDAGPFVAALEYAAGVTATIAGKPSARFFSAALGSLGEYLPSEVVMVGDDPWSDVEGAQRAGLQGWLVRTGKFRPEHLTAGEIKPDRVLGSVADL